LPTPYLFDVLHYDIALPRINDPFER
jgi:hypothetical protein